jgi:hypothetical protein
MALGIQSHIHLDTDDPPTAEYPVAMGTLDFTADVLLSMERGVTGKLHVHRVVDGGGDPYQFVADACTLLLTQAQMATVKALAGKAVYYVPNRHDDDDVGSYATACILVIPTGGITNIDPMGDWWRVQIQVADNETVT